MSAASREATRIRIEQAQSAPVAQGLTAPVDHAHRFVSASCPLDSIGMTCDAVDTSTTTED